MIDLPKTLSEFVGAETAPTLFKPCDVETDLHCVVVEGHIRFLRVGASFPFAPLAKVVLGKSIKFEDAFGTVWNEHLKAVSGLLEHFDVLEFKVAEETILTNDDACLKTLANKEGYKKIDSIVSEVKGTI